MNKRVITTSIKPYVLNHMKAGVSKDFSNLRCTICNHVSHAEIADDLGEWSSSSFYPDGEFGYVCSECQSGIDEVLHDYYLDDEIDERILDEE